MAHERTDSYLKDSISLFHHYKKLGENAIAQCPDAGLFATLDEENNSIAIVVKHMTGNMLSRWTDFLATDGEKASRNRDSMLPVMCFTTIRSEEHTSELQSRFDLVCR